MLYQQEKKDGMLGKSFYFSKIFYIKFMGTKKKTQKVTVQVIYIHAKYQKPTSRQKGYGPNMSLSPKQQIFTLRSEFKVKGHYPWYVTHRI